MAKLPDLSPFSMDELHEIVASANKRLDDLTNAKIAELKAKRAELDAELSKLGASTAPKAGGTIVGNGRTRAKPAVKFRDGKGNEWTGRGAAPRWLVEYEEQGRQRAEFLVAK